MRFDDMIATSLAWPDGSAGDGERLWLQLTDLLAQGRGEEAPELGALALDRLRALQATVPADVRRRAAERLSGRRLPPALVGFFAEDANVTRPLLATVRLEAGEWAAILPAMGDAALAILAARHDLAPEVAATLDPAASSAGHETAAGGDQIRDLLARIEAFQQSPPAEQGFAFAIDCHGRFMLDDGTALDAWLGDEPRGVDGQAIGAWRAGAALADARLSIASGRHGGEWRITATPLVSAAGGAPRYRGTARRPRVDETTAPLAVEATACPRDHRLDLAIHQLRGPLAAVATVGAELGDGTIGQAAASVVGRSQELMDAIDDFDLAVATTGADDPLDAAAVLGRLHSALLPLAEARGVTLTFRIARDLPAIEVDPQALERMFSRLLGATLGLARMRERLVVRLGLDRGNGGHVALVLTRPGRLAGRPAALLRDPPEDATDAPRLAFGFALRLVERLAGEAGGSLTIHDDRLHLSLPGRIAATGRRSG